MSGEEDYSDKVGPVLEEDDIFLKLDQASGEEKGANAEEAPKGADGEDSGLSLCDLDQVGIDDKKNEDDKKGEEAEETFTSSEFQGPTKMADTTGTLLYAMFKDECMTDVTFVIQGTEVKAHGAVAACRGGELKRMLQENRSRVEIDGITPQTFYTVLEYLYTALVQVTNSNMFLLMHAAHELGLVCLQLECVKFLQKKLTIENFAAHATEAVNLGIKESMKVVQEYFGQNTSELLKQEAGIHGCPQEVLRVLCGSEEINCSEVELFLCCMEWAKRKCREKEMKENPENLQHILVDTLDNIRFSTMDNSDFQTVVIPLQVLSFEQIGRIMVARGTEKVRGTKRGGEARNYSENIVDGNGAEKREVSKHKIVDAQSEENIKTDNAANVSLGLNADNFPEPSYEHMTTQHKEIQEEPSESSKEKQQEQSESYKEYMKAAKEYFRLHTSEFLKSEKFKKLSLETLVDLYTAERIECLELDLFIAAMKWYAINKPTKENFHKVLDNIRFPIIPMKDFIETVVPRNILMYEQVGQIIFEMQTKRKVSHYSGECREEIWVHIEAYRWDKDNEWKETRLLTTRATTIGQLKALPVFNGGRKICLPDSFTLRKKGVSEKLEDDVTLGSIQPRSPHQDLELDFHSCSYNIEGKGLRSFDYLSGRMSSIFLWKLSDEIVGNDLKYPGCILKTAKR